ncbi:hypothetical protein CA85_40290 [Allorhodopirellula solitaria]|uniref:Uncharacterized protein n=1 Tax=Allorhodopirellula solitaria TaxID=2527987 RepID=A0A5C5X0W1_9BACT|nr:hypothetical protein CA85_40290 [Allorhodopirellula solitaria]
MHHGHRREKPRQYNPGVLLEKSIEVQSLMRYHQMSVRILTFGLHVMHQPTRPTVTSTPDASTDDPRAVGCTNQRGPRSLPQYPNSTPQIPPLPPHFASDPETKS